MRATVAGIQTVFDCPAAWTFQASAFGIAAVTGMLDVGHIASLGVGLAVENEDRQAEPTLSDQWDKHNFAYLLLILQAKPL